MMNRLNFVGGIGLGLGLMYYVDPVLGRRRRRFVRDQVTHGVHEVSHGLDLASRDLVNRTKGVISNARHLLSEDEVEDTVLVERVRSKMGRAVSHPHAIEVVSQNGTVTLRGSILENEVDRLISHISSIRGVDEIVNQLRIYKKAGDVPMLQGGKPRKGDRFELFQTRWSPSARLLVGLASAGGLIFGVKKRNSLGSFVGGISLGFLGRALSNFEFKRLLGLTGPSSIQVHKTLQIHAPVEKVFEFWSDLQNFQEFLPDVHEIREIGNKRHRWKVAGPAGIPVEWNSLITRLETNKWISWRSEPGAFVQNAGQIHFIPHTHGTQIEIDLSYNPGGAFGHILAKLFGSDPKSKMDDDLMRVKTLLESGPSLRQKQYFMKSR